MPRHHAGPRDGASGPRCCPPSGSSLRVLPQQEEPSDDTEAPTLKWLRRSNRTDLRRFGVVTHTRKVNGLEYPFPPRAPKPIREGPSAFKPAAAEPWAAPQNYWGHTPRLGLVGGLGESGERRDSSSIASNSSSSRSSSSSSSSVESSEEFVELTAEQQWFAACEENAETRQQQQQRRRPPAVPRGDWGPLESILLSLKHSAVHKGALSEVETLLLSASETESSSGAFCGDARPHRKPDSPPLELLPALSQDKFLGGPGGPPLTEEAREHLLRFGLDYEEGPSLNSRKQWGVWERERWRRSRMLRYLIKTEQVVFRKDILKRQFNEDYEKYVRSRHRRWGAPRPSGEGPPSASQSLPSSVEWAQEKSFPGWPQVQALTGPPVGYFVPPGHGNAPAGGPFSSFPPGYWSSGPPGLAAYPIAGPPTQASKETRMSQELVGPTPQLNPQEAPQKIPQRPSQWALEYARETAPHWAPQGDFKDFQRRSLLRGAPAKPLEGEVKCGVMQALLSRGNIDTAMDVDKEEGQDAQQDSEREYRSKLPWCYHFEYEQDLVVQPKPFVETPKTKAPTPLFVQQEMHAELQAAMDTELILLYEAAEGDLPALFSGRSRPNRRKHPKDKIVPFDRLREFGAYINDITSCRLLQQEVDEELSDGWAFGTTAPANVHMDPPRGVRTNPNYVLTKEKVEAAAKKLHMEPKEQTPAFQGLEKRKRLQLEETTKVLGGGRYVV